MKGMVDSIEKLCHKEGTTKRFCYLRDKLNASGGTEAAVTARVGTG